MQENSDRFQSINNLRHEFMLYRISIFEYYPIRTLFHVKDVYLKKRS